MALPAGLMRSTEAVRRVTATDLGIDATPAIKSHSSSVADDPPLSADDPVYQAVLSLMPEYGGVIFTGPPGTSKSWYAAKIADLLTERDEARRSFVQFHPSYQYEDFMQGFVPREDGEGFTLADKCLVETCRTAALDENQDKQFVVVIDELSRADPGRVFGEALTYLERSKRELSFSLASGQTIAIPQNVFIIATMNPLDRGVDEVDAAFDRRFAKIAMEPSREILADRLTRNGVSQELQRKILAFFNQANGFAERNPQGAIGHTYFWNVSDVADLRSVWDYQLRFLIEKAYRLDPEIRNTLTAAYNGLLEAPEEDVAETDIPPDFDPDSP